MQIPPALKNRQFSIFWMGMLCSWIGNQALMVAIPWHISDLTASPWALGAVGLIRLVPTILLSLFSGVIADTFSRRTVLVFTQGLMGLTGLALAILTFSGLIQLWHIYALLAVHATAYVFDLPARYSMTPNLVPKEILANALSVEFLAVQIGGLAGPILSGSLINRFGQPAAYLASAIFFGIMLFALLFLGSIPQRRLVSTQPGVDWEAIRAGIGFTFRHPLILPGMLLDFFATLLTRADSLMPYFAREILGLNAAQYGWLTAASAMGAVTAGLTISQLKTIRNQGKKLIGSVGLVGIGAVVFGFSRSFHLSMAALILVGASDSVSSIIRSTIRQSHTPDRLRGRMTSVNQIFFMGGPYLGDVKSGFIGGLIGVPLAVGLGGIACIFSVGFISLRWPKLRSYNGAESNELEQEK